MSHPRSDLAMRIPVEVKDEAKGVPETHPPHSSMDFFFFFFFARAASKILQQLDGLTLIKALPIGVLACCGMIPP